MHTFTTGYMYKDFTWCALSFCLGVSLLDVVVVETSCFVQEVEVACVDADCVAELAVGMDDA